MSCYIRLMEESVPESKDILKTFREMWNSYNKKPTVYYSLGFDKDGFIILLPDIDYSWWVDAE